MSQRIVGRSADLLQLKAVVDGALAGHGSLVLVCGEPGIGKTRLVEEAVEQAGIPVRWAACWEGEGAPAFWPWIQVLRAHLGDLDDGALRRLLGPDAAEVARLVPEIGPRLGFDGPAGRQGLPAEQARFRLFDAVTSVLRRSADQQPVLIVIDDVQWADVPSLLLLRFLARQLRTMPIAVLATLREQEVEPGHPAYGPLQDLRNDGTTLTLAGLGQDEVADLLEAVLGAEADPGLTRTVHVRTGGNPLFVLEVARLARSTAGPGDRVGVPEGVRAVIGRRLARLPAACLDLLEAGSVVGNSFGTDVVTRATGTDPVHALSFLSEAESAGVLSAARGVGRYTFAHALVREVLYERLPAARRAGLHRAVAEVIESLPDADGERLPELANHLIRAVPAVAPRRAAEAAERAARRALEQLAYEDGVRFARRALEVHDLDTPDDDRRIALLLLLADARQRAGDLPGARETYETVAGLARQTGDAAALAQAALGFGSGLGGFEVRLQDRRQLELLEEALEGLGPEDSALRAWVLARLSVALSFVESEQRRRELAAEAVKMARRLGEPRALAHALAAHCDAIAGPDHCAERLAEAAEIVRLAAEARDRGVELLGRRFRAVALMETGDFSALDAEIDAYATAAAQLSQPLYSWYVPLWRGTRAQMRGAFDEADRFTAEAEAVGAKASSVNARMLGIVQRWMSFALRGRFEETFAEMEEFERVFAGPGYVPYMAIGYAWTFGALGRLEEARARMAPVVADRLAFAKDAEWLCSMFQIGEYARHAEDTLVAELLYGLLEPYGELFGVEGIGAGCWGPAHRCLGVTAAILGRYDDAQRHLDRALSLAERAGSPVFAADALRDLGWLQHRRGNPSAARDPLERALELYRKLGADGWAERVEAMLDGSVAPSAPGGNELRREGDYWTLGYAGTAVRLKDMKGLHDLAVLLARPGEEVHALDLAGGRAAAPSRTEGLHEQGHAGEVLDDAARDAYRSRLAELEEEIGEAEAFADEVRAERARGEREAIAAELARAYGLGGRKRRSGDPAERARSTVTQRIRDVLSRIEQAHPEAGRHLRHSVRTGTYCSYRPEQPTPWVLTP